MAQAITPHRGKNEAAAWRKRDRSRDERAHVLRRSVELSAKMPARNTVFNDRIEAALRSFVMI
jgi:hypothetical protein